MNQGGPTKKEEKIKNFKPKSSNAWQEKKRRNNG